MNNTDTHQKLFKESNYSRNDKIQEFNEMNKKENDNASYKNLNMEKERISPKKVI